MNRARSTRAGRRTRGTRVALGLAVMSFGAFGALGALLGSGGCGGTASTGETADATSDGPIVIVPVADGSRAPAGDAGDANAATDAPIDYGDAGNCSPVNGACDVVLNNCPSMDGLPAECIPFDEAGSSKCVTERPSQHLPVGHTCCPPLKTETEGDASFLVYDTENEPCLPGSTCNGDPCTDAGATARCSPRCCDDSVCGVSVPEGIVGSCDLEIVDDNQNVLYSICTYERPCRPFQVTPCPEGQVCLVEDHLGTATCSPTYFPDGGVGHENDGCNAGNSCADGLGCILFDEPVGEDGGDGGESDAGDDGDASVTVGFCLYYCVVQGLTPPFDAGSSGAPGYGGCPAGEICNQLDPVNYPAWLGYCQ